MGAALSFLPGDARAKCNSNALPLSFPGPWKDLDDKLSFLNGTGIPGGCEVSLDLVTENWTTAWWGFQGACWLFVKTLESEPKMCGLMSPSQVTHVPTACRAGVGVGRQAPVCEYTLCTLVLTRLTE